ncbi:MAG: ABC transporter ATP-binding protein [Bacillota bacterium]|nr:ABC transporter ATP-binding protein [Bacillota bacterium]
MLEVINVRSFYGNVQVLWDVSLRVNEGEIVALVGANGAGKTTLLNTISGLLPPASGEVVFLGNRVTGWSPHRIVELGISYVPQGGRVFPDMTVRENLEIGAYARRAWKKKEESLKRVYRLFPRLKERENQLAKTLSGGEQQMLAVARGLMGCPKLCILDEVSYGLAPRVVSEVFTLVHSLRQQGITVLLIEQNVRQALETADRAYVLENGRVVLEGAAEEFLGNDYVRRAYLGL